MFVPEDWTPHQKWPVILFLHGSGERGEDGMDQTDVGIGTAIRSDRGHFHAIVVMPQCRKNTWWTSRRWTIWPWPRCKPRQGISRRPAAHVSHRNFDGRLRQLVPCAKYPDKFAALVVICGGIHPPDATLKAHPELVKFSPPDGPKAYADAAAKVGKLPVWIFHGGDDNIVPVAESQRMADAMKAVGAEVHYTEYPGVKHVSWDKAYDEPKLYPWLYSEDLSAKQAEKRR